MNHSGTFQNKISVLLMKGSKPFYQWKLLPLMFLFAIACRNNSDIPFPKDKEANAQPIPVALHFSEEKDLSWDTVSSDVSPITKPFRLDALPAEPLKIPLFEDLPTIPPDVRKEVKFNYDSLPEQALDIQSLTSNSLSFKTSLITISNRVKVKPTEQGNRSIAIYDLGAAQGLPTSVITALYKDKNGIMWIAGSEGIYRYDGQYVETIVKNSTSAIAGLNEDNAGNIWFIQYGGVGMINMQNGTVNYSQKLSAERDNLCKITKSSDGDLWIYNETDSAMAIIDPETFTYKSLNEKGAFKNTKSYQAVEDNEHQMWVTTYFSGVHIINQATGKMKVLTLSNYFKDAVIAALAKDNKGNMWLTTINGGVYEVDIKKGLLRMHYAGDRNVQFVFNAAFDKGNRLWTTTPGGIMIVDVNRDKFKWIHVSEGLSTNVVYDLLIDDESNVWISSPLGVNIIGQQGDPNFYLSGISVISMMEDNNQNLWVGSQQGIKIVDFKEKLIRTLNLTDGLGNNFIQSFLRTPDEMIITTNGGISIINLSKNTISYLGKKQGLVNDTVYVSFKDRANNLWLSGPTNGIDKLDASGKMVLHTDKKKGLNDLNIQDIKEDNTGQIWIATRRGGVDVYNPETRKVKYLNNLPGLKDICNKMLLKDNYGRIWIGTNKGIYVTDTKEGTITNISTSHGLASNTILSLLPYKGSVMVGMTNKVAIVTAPVPHYAIQASEGKTGQWKIETLHNSQRLKRRNNSAWNTDAVTAAGSYLWGDVGVSAINTVQPEYHTNTTYITGITIMTRNYDFTNKYQIKNNDTLFTTDTFYIKGQQPKLSNLSAPAEFKWDSVSGPFNMPVNLSVPYHQNYLQFQFSKIGMTDKDTAWYMYVLQGIDKKWSEPTSNNFTENYLNLPSGNYTFKVSSKGVNGKWSQPVSYSFSITPPWYKSWWAYTLLALAGIGILRAYIVYRSKRLQRENKLLEEKVAQRTEELNHSLESLRQTQAQLVQSEKMASLGELTAGIAHEIQNPLNFVNNFSEVSKELVEEMEEALANDDKDEAIAIAVDIKSNLDKIAHHGKRADSIVKGMLQHSRISNGKKEPTDINALADEYLRLSYHGLRAKDKLFNAKMETDFDESIGKIELLPQDFGRVLLNLFNNAFYAVNEKKNLGVSGFNPTVSVTTKRNADNVEIEIKDNGMGIPKQVVDKIFQPFFTTKPTGQGTGLGLSLSYDIITNGHGGEISVDTEEGKGTIFNILLHVK